MNFIRLVVFISQWFHLRWKIRISPWFPLLNYIVNKLSCIHKCWRIHWTLFVLLLRWHNVRDWLRNLLVLLYWLRNWLDNRSLIWSRLNVRNLLRDWLHYRSRLCDWLYVRSLLRNWLNILSLLRYWLNIRLCIRNLLTISRLLIETWLLLILWCLPIRIESAYIRTDIRCCAAVCRLNIGSTLTLYVRIKNLLLNYNCIQFENISGLAWLESVASWNFIPLVIEQAAVVNLMFTNICLNEWQLVVKVNHTSYCELTNTVGAIARNVSLLWITFEILDGPIVWLVIMNINSLPIRHPK